MIEVTGLRVALPPATVILDGVDLAVQPGEFVVILGKSGAGKTTLLRTINRLVEPTAGTIRVDGHLVTGARPAALREIRRRIGMIFQQFNLVRRISVMENVLAGRLGYVPTLSSLTGHFPAEDRRRALECLAQVGLAHLAERRADTLSGGEQQRVAIARALAQAPAVILADEPTASLDPQLTGSIMDLLRRINVEHGITLVVSQHQLETALAYAGRLVGLRQGRVMFDGAPAAVTPAVVGAIYGESPA
ncbi:MAG TPA: phosphonate ABC transporter ATP-binding protein [Methylomirabilota bacterium]|jgi:phosphonate transport system ATP-binding protein|nr:phosphonate ABC transporter ATP-binding protein [Methylomirabilota bacterium]